MRWLALVACCLALATAAQAQEQRLSVRVEAIAGENAYFDAGTQRGLGTGDTLTVFRGDALAGRVRIVSATPSRSVVAFLDAPFALTRGEALVVAFAAPPEPVPPLEPAPDSAVAGPDRASIFAQPTVSATPRASPDPVRLSGRIQIGTTVLQSQTKPLGGGAATARTFATPFFSARGQVTGLPGDLRLNFNGRATYRYRSDGDFDEPLDPRLYQASAEKALGPVRVEVGRFYNEYDRYSGYLDGVSVHVGSPVRGVGVTAGVQPDRADAGFSSDLPKYTFFAHYRLSPKPLRVELRAVAGQILPQNSVLEPRTFFGLTHRTSGDRFSVSTDVLVDEDPTTGDLAFSRLLARGSVEVAEGVRLRARFQQRRPYILFENIQELRELSERVGGGLSVRLPGRALGGTTVRADVSSASAGDLPASLTVSGGLYVPRLPYDLGFTSTASVWTRDDRQSIYASASFTRSFGDAYGSLGYRYQQTPLLGESLVTHGAEGTLQIRLSRDVSATVQGSAQFGETLTTLRVYTGLGWRL